MKNKPILIRFPTGGIAILEYNEFEATIIHKYLRFQEESEAIEKRIELYKLFGDSDILFTWPKGISVY